MFTHSKPFSSFSSNNIPATGTFYSDVLGLRVTEHNGILELLLSDDTKVIVYPKSNHEPATYTVLNFPVTDIEAAWKALSDKNVQFEHYNMPGGIVTDEKGIFRGGGPLIAWFKDPVGNILSIMEAM